jgi:hypothetical protein
MGAATTPCGNYSHPTLRWRINGVAPSHEPAIATTLGGPPPPRVLFVPTHKWPSFNHRCVDAAVLTNQTSLPCGDLEATTKDYLSQYDVFVHCKFLCKTLVPLLRDRLKNNSKRRAPVHILDRVDSYGRIERPRHDNDAVNVAVDAEIFNTPEHMNSSCGSRACVVIPHHYNLHCVSPCGEGPRLSDSRTARHLHFHHHGSMITPRQRQRCESLSALPAPPPSSRVNASRSRVARVAVGLVGSVNEAIVRTLRGAADVHLLFEPFDATAPHQAQLSGA